MNQFLMPDSMLPVFYQYPKFLLKEPTLNDTDRTVYMILLDRARLSASNSWVDDDGRVYENFTIASLAETIGKGASVVKSALLKLEKADLICRSHMKRGSPSRIYVKIPDDCERAMLNVSNQDAGNPQKNRNGKRKNRNNMKRRYVYNEGESL